MADSKVRANMLNLSGDYPFTGSVTGHVADGSITAAKLSGTISASKLTGALPALDGSTLTGIPGITKSASDPAVDTNPSGGVGSLWANTTSGEMFACTDATAGANIWTNVGSGSGDVVPYSFQGSNYGYVYGGASNAGATEHVDVQKYSFTSDGAGTDVGSLNSARHAYTAASSVTHGYCMGGWSGTQEYIDKFAFAVANGFTASLVGNLGVGRNYCSGFSTQSYGFAAGGNPGTTNRIDRFDFANEGQTTDWADLHTGTASSSNGVSGATHGYTASTTLIQKFQYASQVTGTVYGGSLTYASISQSGATASTTHGYIIGGNQNPTSKTIQKFSFATENSSTLVGDIFSDNNKGIFLPSSASSTDYGYRAGGDDMAGGTEVNVIDKHSFSADGNATDVGDLDHARNYLGQGSQY